MEADFTGSVQAFRRLGVYMTHFDQADIGVAANRYC
jgi:hypothetical protein